MTYDDAFLRAILENPDDDTPRLIYADWLEERGEARGEFIRIQCLLAEMPADDEQRSLLERRERELLARHQDRWLGELRPLLSGWTFHRGFLDTISVPAPAYLQRSAIPHPATVRQVQVNLDGFEPPRSILEFVPESVARENFVLPIGSRGRTLVMAAGEPFDADLLAKMQFIFNRRIELVIADAEQVREAINRLYDSRELEYTDCIFIDYTDPFFEPDMADDDSPVAKLVALLIQEARAVRAGQIRIQPRSESIQVLYRIDRKWVERDAPPRRLLNPIVSRIRHLAQLASNDEGKTQTGLLRGNSGGIPCDLAVHIQPMEQGPSITLMFRPTSEPEA
jgi:type IV pilus assembly protein PilB